MEGKFRDLEAELILEIKKVDWIESMRATGEIDDELAILEAKKLARSIAEILENDNELEELFLDSYNRIVKEKMFDDFTGLVDDSRISIKYHSKNNKTEEELGDIPDNLDKIVEYLSRDSVIADNPQDSKFNLRYYLALYLVYRIHDQKYFIHSDQKSKKGLYDAVWGELTDVGIAKDSAICKKCGTHNSPDARFCTGCGESLMDTCPGCNSSIPQHIKFCPECGLNVEEANVVVCVSCGDELPEGAKFCLNCGTKVEDNIGNE